MSIRLIGHVFGLELPSITKLVLIALADNANDEGYCYPSQSTLATKSSLSERRVRDHLHELESKGWLSVLERGNGRGKSTVYQLNVGRIKADESSIKADAPSKIKADAPSIKADDFAERRTNPVLKADDSVRPTVKEPSSDPSGTVSSSSPREDDLFDAEGLSPPQREIFTEMLNAVPNRFRFDGESQARWRQIAEDHPPDVIRAAMRLCRADNVRIMWPRDILDRIPGRTPTNGNGRSYGRNHAAPRDALTADEIAAVIARSG